MIYIKSDSEVKIYDNFITIENHSIKWSNINYISKIYNNGELAWFEIFIENKSIEIGIHHNLENPKFIDYIIRTKKYYEIMNDNQQEIKSNLCLLEIIKNKLSNFLK